MRVYYSELCCLNQPIPQMLDTLAAHGGTHIELMTDGQYWDALEENRERLVGELRSRSIRYTLHPAAWDMNLTSESKEIRAATDAHYRRSIQLAHDIEAAQVVIHPGFTTPYFNRGLAQGRASEAVASLAAFAEPLGVRLAVENVGNRSTCLYTQEEFVHALDGMGESVGYLLDLGHAQITGFDIPGLVRAIAPRLFGLHIHDNNGREDQHLPIGEGVIDYPAIYAAFPHLREDCHLILEYQCGIDPALLARDKALLEAQQKQH